MRYAEGRGHQGHNRRLRSTKVMRSLVRETSPVSLNELVYPLFVKHGKETLPIKSMPGQKQWCLSDLKDEVLAIRDLGISALLLFGIPERKDNVGSDNTDDNGLMSHAIKMIKDLCPELLIISDMCLCDYASHGHCMVLDDNHRFDLNRTLQYLSEASLVHARAGADVIAPSGNVDTMVRCIRSALDENSFLDRAILSYSAKYASALYAPFREACESAPQYFDRASYQLDTANSDEALKEVFCDLDEGADMVMVKPALHLDIISRIRKAVHVPLAAYHVSGEYSMIEAASSQGFIDKKKVVMEAFLSIKRAGANFIISYFAKDYARWINN